MSLVRIFPGLGQGPFRITSQPDPNYNCIAWAASRVDQFWWPGIFWPSGVPKKETRKSFVRAFEGLGYQVCAGPDPEIGFEKVVLFEKLGTPTHAARLLPDGWWSSKLGSAHDISHSLNALNGEKYGKPAVFMRRPLV